ncbi:Tubulin/FtsZ family, GTPase domain [Halopenitus malekzadehii]|uniref:Tubulin/FtsZ family, GTPase domain n=1 Tax=Halopenitus malekzadehii TaxID=1267564 RepID=A0A1H6IHU2_9EURY|nr:cell division protein FtsZ [Halopenitus malekzadehii]SEH46772.1 Tubulin/FtsZ family, GTPase domain [Halopenitus malekzadehii]
MVYLFVGTGQAGSALVDEVFAHEGIRIEAAPLALNSTVRDLENLSHIDDDEWIGVSETDGLVPGTQAGFEEVVTGGFGRRPRRANDVMERHGQQLVPMLENRFGEDGNVPFAFVFLGLGGGTGCGIAPHVVDAIRRYAAGDVKVIAVAVLPNTQESVHVDASEDDETVSAGRQASNAVYGLDRLEETVDGIMLVDNQRLGYEDAAEGRFAEYNEYVAGSVVDLVSGPVVERIDPGEYDEIDAPIIDIQDIVTSLSFGAGPDGEPGYGTIGRSIEMTKSLPGYFLPLIGDQQVDAAELAYLAQAKQSVDDVSFGDAKKAIGHVRAPRQYIADPEYQIEISEVRRRLNEHCSEVNLGMVPTSRNLVSCTTVYTFERTDLNRIREIEEIAETYEAA